MLLDSDSMVRLFSIGLLAFVVLSASVASSQTLDEREKRVSLLRGHQSRLEKQLSEQARRIKRLKSQPAGVGRDYQLKSALRTTQQLARRLTKLRYQLRSAYADLMRDYQQAIRKASDAAQKRALERRSAELAKSRSRQGSSRIVTDDEASPFDSPDDLEEKADLLEDSEEKVRRQLRQLRGRLARLKKRSRLHRHAADADDSPFVENAPRRTSRIRSSRVTTPAADAAGDAASKNVAGRSVEAGESTAKPPPAQTDADDSPAVPAPPPHNAEDGSKDAFTSDPSLSSASTGPPVSGAGSWKGPGMTPSNTAGGSGSSTSVSVTVQDVIDPDTLRKLSQAGSAGDIRSRLAELRKVTSRLDHLANRLSRKAKSLRKRAKKLRRRK